VSALATAFGATAADPQDAALAARLVERRCGPDAPLVLAILGLDTPGVQLPSREPGTQVTPHPYRRATKGRRPR
jgi:hypothetical protein